MLVFYQDKRFKGNLSKKITKVDLATKFKANLGLLIFFFTFKAMLLIFNYLLSCLNKLFKYRFTSNPIAFKTVISSFSKQCSMLAKVSILKDIYLCLFFFH